MIELSAKKKFLSWLIQCVPLKRKESYWLLNYLLKHEALLQHVSFVEGALDTPRGILITDDNVSGIGLEMKKGSQLIQDSQEIYSELRNNKKEALYLEVLFIERDRSIYYDEVLEENDYLPINQEAEALFFDSLDAFMAEEKRKLKKRELEKGIDTALATNNRDLFLQLTKEYLLLNEKKVTPE